MATLEECRAAVTDLAERMQSSGDKTGLGERTVSCHVSDLGVTFHGQLKNGELTGITTEEQPKRAQIRFTSSSDDLVALTEGSLDVGKAWLSKRIKIEASMVDLIKLKSMF